MSAVTRHRPGLSGDHLQGQGRHAASHPEAVPVSLLDRAISEATETVVDLFWANTDYEDAKRGVALRDAEDAIRPAFGELMALLEEACSDLEDVAEEQSSPPEHKRSPPEFWRARALHYRMLIKPKRTRR